MKHQLFISYSDFDKDKVDLIIKELEDHYLFSPLVIASNREALRPLAEKVINGIKASTVFIPIMTAKSISTQWINQEIGFAKAIDKKTIPLVEGTILKDLKGFIHKEIDLPYNFITDNSNTDFLKTLRLLIADLEVLFSQIDVETKPKKTAIEESLSVLDEVNNKIQAERKKKEILKSEEGLNIAKKEVFDMFNYIKGKLNELETQSKLRFAREEEQYTPTFIFKSEGFSCSIIFRHTYIDSLDESMLIIGAWTGHFTKNPNMMYTSDRAKPKNVSEMIFQFGLDDEMKNCWIYDKDNSYNYSTTLADNLVAWIVKEIATKRQKENNLR
jgi:TIR domain-containing protein